MKSKFQNKIMRKHTFHLLELHLMFTKVEEIPLLIEQVGKIGSKRFLNTSCLKLFIVFITTSLPH